MAEIETGIQPVDSDVLKTRTKRFALDAIALTEALPRNRVADVIARQLIRSATSVGANYRAACRARSTSEFIAKLGVVEEEADESLYWLELLNASKLTSQARVKVLSEECESILRIIVASIKTSRSGRRSPIRNQKSEIRNGGT